MMLMLANDSQEDSQAHGRLRTSADDGGLLTTVVQGVLMIPVFVCYGILVRHMVRSLKLRKAEQREGRIVYTRVRYWNRTT